MPMVSLNLFRTLGGNGNEKFNKKGLKVKTPTMDPDEEEPNLDE
jgi:hypothetical protein